MMMTLSRRASTGFAILIIMALTASYVASSTVDGLYVTEKSTGNARESARGGGLEHLKRKLQDVSTSPSQSPSASPTYSVKLFTSPLLAMDLEGLSIDDMEGSRAQDHWRSTTAEYIRSYWDSTSQQSFSPILSIQAFIEYRQDISKELAVSDQSAVRIVYTLEFQVRTSSDVSIPQEILSFPVTPAYVNTLKQNDPTTLKLLGKVSTVTNKGVYDGGDDKEEEVTSYPTFSPTPRSSMAPSAMEEPLHNAKSDTMNIVINVLLTGTILMGLATLFVMWKYVPKGHGCKLVGSNQQPRSHGTARYHRGENQDTGDASRFPVALDASHHAPDFS